MSLKHELLTTITALRKSKWSYSAGGLLGQVRVMSTTIHKHSQSLTTGIVCVAVLVFLWSSQVAAVFP